MTLSRMEKYHNNKNKKFKKSIATALMGTVLVAPVALSSASVNADTVPAGSQPTQTEWVTNSVSTVRAEMQAQGLNLNDVNGKYVVRQGDTLSAISIAAHESMQQIANDNHITNLDMIYIGQVLYLRHTNESTMIANANVEGTTGNGTTVAHAPRTSTQVQANALVNQGVMPNVGSSVVMNNNNARPASSASVAHHAPKLEIIKHQLRTVTLKVQRLVQQLQRTTAQRKLKVTLLATLISTTHQV